MRVAEVHDSAGGTQGSAPLGRHKTFRLRLDVEIYCAELN
jgi:hypothetical protein